MTRLSTYFHAQSADPNILQLEAEIRSLAQPDFTLIATSRELSNNIGNDGISPFKISSSMNAETPQELVEAISKKSSDRHKVIFSDCPLLVKAAQDADITVISERDPQQAGQKLRELHVG